MTVPLWLRGVVRRDLVMLVATPWSAVLTLAGTVLGVQVFGLLGRYVGRDGSYIAFVVTGIAFLRVADAVVQSPGQGLREERTRGSLEVLCDIPRPTWHLVLAGGIVSTVRSALEGALALLLATALFDVGLHPGLRGLLLVPLAVVAAACLALATGIFFAAAGLRSRAVTAITTFFGLAVALTSEVYYPLSVLPRWLELVGQLSPYRYALRGLRRALTGSPDVLRDVLVTLGSSAVLLAVGAVLMERAVRSARRTGSFVHG